MTATKKPATRPTTKRPAVKRSAPKLKKPAIEPPAVRSGTGVDLIDGQPYFATVNGVRMNRRQWLAATAGERKADLVESLRASAELDADTGPVSSEP